MTITNDVAAEIVTAKAEAWAEAHEWLLSLVHPASSDIDPIRAQGFEDGYMCAVALLGKGTNPYLDDEES